MAPHPVRAQSTYKDIRIHSFHPTHTLTYTHKKCLKPSPFKAIGKTNQHPSPIQSSLPARATAKGLTFPAHPT